MTVINQKKNRSQPFLSFRNNTKKNHFCIHYTMIFKSEIEMLLYSEVSFFRFDYIDLKEKLLNRKI